jgi:AAA family ATP:ADP antiporter
MIRRLERLLHLRPGESRRGLLLFAYLFLVITSYVTGKAARDALFLDRYKAVQLPYADMPISILVGVIIALYIRVGRRVSLHRLLAASLVFWATNCLIFWALVTYTTITWLFPVIYIWTGVFGVLAPAQVWTLANYVLTTREAKRLFGLIGGGAIAGWIVGGLLTQYTATRYGTESALLAMAVALLACAFLVVEIWRQRPVHAAEDELSAGPRGLRDSVRLIASSPYLMAIAAVVGMSSLATSVGAWQFKAIAKEFIPQKDALTAFFGKFNFYAGLLSFAAQLLFTTRFLRRFGIGFALFVVPALLLAGSINLLIFGTLVAAVLLRGSDQVLRYSLDKTSVELLYLPVPAAHKVPVKSFIDTVVWRVGDGLSAVLVLIFAGALHLSASRMSIVTIVLLGGWVTAATIARRQYVVNLRDSIYQHRLDSERMTAPLLDRSATELLAGRLSSGDPNDILYALELFGADHGGATHPAVRGLLHHESADVRQRALAILAAAGDRTVMADVERLLYDRDLNVRTEALLYLTHLAHIDPLERIEALGDFPDFSIRSAMVAFLARPGDSQNLDAAGLLLDGMLAETGEDGRRTRLEAARLVASLPDAFEDQLKHLLSDRDPDVARHAIKAVGALKTRAMVEYVIDRLGDSALAEHAADALARFSDRIVAPLAERLGDRSVSIDIRREIPNVLLRIATPDAEAALFEGLLDGDHTIRLRVISAINKLRQTDPGRPYDVPLVETAVAAEIMGHYRSYQVVGLLASQFEQADPVVQAVRESIRQEVERIFRLLKILYPDYDLHSAYFGLQSTNSVVHDNALEFLDTILKPQMRTLLVPLLDSEVTIEERVALANRLLGTSVASHEEAIATLMLTDNPWLQSCAAYAIGSLGLKKLEPELDKWLNAPDPLLRESAKQAKERLSS